MEKLGSVLVSWISVPSFLYPLVAGFGGLASRMAGDAFVGGVPLCYRLGIRLGSYQRVFLRMGAEQAMDWGFGQWGFLQCGADAFLFSSQ